MVCAASPPQEADIDVLGLYCGAPEVIIVQLRSRKDGANIVRVEDKRPDSESRRRETIFNILIPPDTPFGVIFECWHGDRETFL